jgi:hypothetical protein
MPIEVTKVDPPDDDELLEQWSRGDVGDRNDVEALLPLDHPWQIVVGLAEFVREDPLETQMSDAVYAALTGVAGVTRVAREDTEVWLAWGTPSGADLVRAVARVVDELLPAVEEDRAQGRRQPLAPVPPSAPMGPLIACAVLAVLGVVLLVSGLRTGDSGTAALGGVAALFFGGGSLVLMKR